MFIPPGVGIAECFSTITAKFFFKIASFAQFDHILLL